MSLVFAETDEAVIKTLLWRIIYKAFVCSPINFEKQSCQVLRIYCVFPTVSKAK